MAWSATQNGATTFGDRKVTWWTLVGDGSTAYYDTGMDHVDFAWLDPGDEDVSVIYLTYNSNDGTAGTAPGYLHFGTALTDTKITRVCVFGK